MCAMPSAPVVVLGSANADLVVALDRRPLAGETVLGSDLVTMAGGKGANQAVAAARLGTPVSFVGCVGDDDHGRMLRSSLRAAGVDDAFLHIRGVPTGVAIVLLTPDGDNSIVVSSGANATLNHADVETARELLAGAAVLVLQREVDPAVSAAAAAIVDDAGGRVVLALAPSGPVPRRLIALADPLIVNEQEALDLIDSNGRPGTGGKLTGEELAEAVRAAGSRSAVVTFGAAGAVAAEPGRVVRVATIEVTAVDTTGAGDALTGALAGRLAAGDDLVTALRLAVRVAAFSVTRAGAQPSYPSAAELAGWSGA
jgi:ribokinase